MGDGDDDGDGDGLLTNGALSSTRRRFRALSAIAIVFTRGRPFVLPSRQLPLTSLTSRGRRFKVNSKGKKWRFRILQNAFVNPRTTFCSPFDG